MKFTFADVVVVDGNNVGVVVKCWQSLRYPGRNTYDVYVRSHNAIREYAEDAITRFIFDKELSDEAMSYYPPAAP